MSSDKRVRPRGSFLASLRPTALGLVAMTGCPGTRMPGPAIHPATLPPGATRDAGDSAPEARHATPSPPDADRATARGPLAGPRLRCTSTVRGERMRFSLEGLTARLVLPDPTGENVCVARVQGSSDCRHCVRAMAEIRLGPFECARETASSRRLYARPAIILSPYPHIEAVVLNAFADGTRGACEPEGPDALTLDPLPGVETP